MNEVPEDGVHPAIVEFDGRVIVQIPEQAVAGEPIPISVFTWVGGHISPGHTEVSRDGDVIVIEPFDDFGSGFLDIRTPFPHDTTLTIEEPGTIQVVVRGKSVPGYRDWARGFQVEVR